MTFRHTRHISGDLIITARLTQELIASALSPLGITYAQAVALVRLWRGTRETRQTDLIESLALSRASGTIVLKELEDRGLISRRADDRDARRYIVELTQLGIDLEPQVLEAFDDVEGELVDHIDRRSLAHTQAVLRGLLEAARDQRIQKREDP